MLIFLCTKKDNNKRTYNNKDSVYTDFTLNSEIKESKKIKTTTSNNNSNYSFGYYEASKVQPPALLTEEDIKSLKKRRDAKRELIQKNAVEWLKNKTSDPNFCQETIEKYKIRSHQGFVNGTYAFMHEDYDAALKFFNETIKDSEASAITKYFAIQNIMKIAYKKKDFELFFIAARMNATMCATGDLALLGIKKDTHQLEWVEKVERSLRARNNQKYFEECVQAKLDYYQDGINREEAEKEVKKDIALYSDLYKELIE